MRISDIKRTTQVFAVKTSIAHEKGVAEMIHEKLKYREPKPNIMSIVWIEQLRGYIFIEAPHQRDVMIAISDIKHVKGRVLGQVQMEDLDKFLIPGKITDKLERGDKVEIISGVFAGEKAYVSEIDEAKDEVTLSFIGSDNQIPIKVNADYLKILEKGVGSATASDDTIEAESEMVGKGIKEYTFGESSGTETEMETFGDDVESDEEKKEPEVIVVSGHRQKVVGEMFELNIDEDDLEDEFDFDDEFIDEGYGSDDNDGGDIGNDDEIDKDGDTGGDSQEDETEDDW